MIKRFETDLKQQYSPDQESNTEISQRFQESHQPISLSMEQKRLHDRLRV